MENSEIKKIAHDYKKSWARIRLLISIVFLCVAYISYRMLFDYSLIIISVCALIMFYSIAIIGVTHFNKRIVTILTNDLDPQKYLAVLKELNGFAPNGLYLLNAYVFMGRHQDTINICTNRLHHKEFAYYRLFYLHTIASCYFELNDVDKLRAVCDKLEIAIKDSKYNKNTIEQYQNTTAFFRCYTNEDFDGCRASIEKSKTYATANSQKIYVSFKEAVVASKEGNTEKAKELFEGICTDAPKLWIAELSKKHVQAMEEKEQVVISEQEILPDEFYVYPYEPTKKAKRLAKTLKALRILFLIFLCLGIIYLFIFGA